jgi:hypothetical protein
LSFLSFRLNYLVFLVFEVKGSLAARPTANTNFANGSVVPDFLAIGFDDALVLVAAARAASADLATGLEDFTEPRAASADGDLTIAAFFAAAKRSAPYVWS